MAEMRRASNRLMDSSGDVLEFAGGPVGFADAAASTFQFDGVNLSHVSIDLGRSDTDTRAHRLFRDVRRRLASRYGSPWYDALRDRDADRGGAWTTTWSDTRSKITLRARSDRRVTVTITKASMRAAARRGEGTGTMRAAWATDHFETEGSRAKSTAEDMLYDFGNQRFLAWGARRKGAPIGIRLKAIRVAKNSAGVDRNVILGRFLNFAKGNGEVAMAGKGRRADVDLKIAVTPTLRHGQRVFAMKIEARGRHGKSRGRLLYSATRYL